MELRKQGITQSDVLGAIERVPREAFVPETFQNQAYENMALLGMVKQKPAGGRGVHDPGTGVGPRMKVLNRDRIWIPGSNTRKTLSPALFDRASQGAA